MSSGNIPANIESIVSNLNNIIWEQAIFEAVTNALQANANNIEIKFINNALDLEKTNKYVEKIIITDDGVGFHEENTKSFQEYGSQYKRKKLKISAKGIGRFLYLKIFEQINIKSLDKEISFSIEKDIDVITLEDKKYNDTSLVLSKPRFEFVVNYDKLADTIKEHFIAYFRLLQDRDISIVIYENNKKKVEIKNSEIPTFEKLEFILNGHVFLLEYVFNSNDIRANNGYYCAGGRVVIKNSDLDTKRKLKAFENINILYLLSSTYFDNNVNNSRDNFTIMPLQKQQQNMFQNTSWKDIQDRLKEEIKLIAKNHNIDINEIANKNLKQSLIDAPFLSYYLKDNQDAYSSERLIEEARKKLEEDKKLVREEGETLDNYQELFSVITQAELVEYMFDRQNDIKRLKSLTTDEALESELHNLFMKRNTQDTEQNYRTNKLWLFDDRFMTYNKVFSEKQIKQIFPTLSDNLDRPDILSIVSNTYNKEEITDIVIIELKRASDKITPSRAEEQLIDYAGYINDAYEDKKIRIWTYAFLKFDKKTERSLRNKGYNRVLTTSEYPIYYHPFNEVNTIVNFIDYKALADDAENRHNLFMKILTGKTL